MKLRLLVAMMMSVLVGAPASGESIGTGQVVRSPDGRNSISIVLDSDGRATYSVARDGEPIIL
ncbi:MAG TPA: hypothetical protein VK474_06255, partial [Chthoniobacterales bacterium]|nr:hypothetical protein [Chthoniobacterales bacterium]